MGKEQEFINKITPFIQKYAKKYNIKVVSPIIAQACLESAYGTSKKATFNNFFGLKYRKNRVKCNSGYFQDGGSEQNPNGTYTSLSSTTAWYAFQDMEHGVEGYFQFINIPHYANLKTTNDPYTYLTYIKQDGYATSINYVNNVSNVIKKWNLTQYDFQKEEKNKTMAINIIKKTGTHGMYHKTRQIKYLVIHYTAGVTSKVGTARNTASWFANPRSGGTVDFIVDDGEIVQYNPDPLNYAC